MTTTASTHPHRLACYIIDEATRTTLKTIPLKDHNVIAEIHEGGIEYAISHLKQDRSPDILLVDISKSAMPLSDLAALAEVCEPRVEVLVIGDKNDVGLFRDLMKSGVRDYLVKPLMESILLKSIQEIVRQEEVLSAQDISMIKSGKIIAVMGSRGGIGVSSIVANLGILLSETYEKRTCMIDMDLHTGTLPQYLDIETSEGFSQLFESPDRIDKVILDRYMTLYNERLGVLCSELSFMDKPQVKLESIDALFNFIAPQYHYTLIDLPRHFSQEMTSYVLTKANQLVVLCDYSMTSLKDTCRILQLAKAFPNLNHGIIVLANQVGLYQQGQIERETYEETIQRPVSLEIKFDPEYPLQALLDGEPVIVGNKGNLAQGIQSLAKVIMGQTITQADSNSVLNRLIGMFRQREK